MPTTPISKTNLRTTTIKHHDHHQNKNNKKHTKPNQTKRNKQSPSLRQKLTKPIRAPACTKKHLLTPRAHLSHRKGQVHQTTHLPDSPPANQTPSIRMAVGVGASYPFHIYFLHKRGGESGKGGGGAPSLHYPT